MAGPSPIREFEEPHSMDPAFSLRRHSGSSTVFPNDYFIAAGNGKELWSLMMQYEIFKQDLKYVWHYPVFSHTSYTRHNNNFILLVVIYLNMLPTTHVS